MTPDKQKVSNDATFRDSPACRNGRKAPRLSADATGRSHLRPQKSDGDVDCVRGACEKSSMARPVVTENNNPRPEAPPSRTRLSNDAMQNALASL